MSDNFLDSFHKSLNNLAAFNDKLTEAITSDKQNKDEFLAYVNNELGNINTKIKTLEGLITAINDELNKLRSASDDNANLINQNNDAKAALEQKITELTNVEAQLKEQLKESEQKAQQLQSTLQKQIDEKEAQILQLNGENETLKSESASLQKQLSDRSQNDAEQAAALDNLSKEQAATIQKLTEEHKAALDNQMNENNAKIAQLTTEIDNRDKQITELSSQSSSQVSSLTAELEQCKQSQTQTTEAINALTRENESLKEKNARYKENIEQATLIINETLAKLNNILEQIPTAQDRTTITKLFDEINEEIEKLSGLLSGQQSVTKTVLKETSESSKLSDDTIINLEGKDVPLSTIKQMLLYKIQQLYRNKTPDDQNKYLKSLKQMNKAKSAAEVIASLYDNSVEWKNDKIMGGKTKKLYKKHSKSKMHSRRKNQKGGFIYNSNNHKSSVKSNSSKGGKKRTKKVPKKSKR